jgi:hypothetical protein
VIWIAGLSLQYAGISCSKRTPKLRGGLATMSNLPVFKPLNNGLEHAQYRLPIREFDPVQERDINLNGNASVNSSFF